MRLFADLSALQLPASPVHLALGMFDGVHRGHQAVIGAARTAARSAGGQVGVLTFWPHPSAVLRPDQPTPLLYPATHKRRLLESLGLDFLIEQSFTPEFARTAAGDFVQSLRRVLPAQATLYVGENFRFGRGRSGDAATLASGAAKLGCTVCIVPRLQHAEGAVSSSRVRELLAAGRLDEANDLLGYTYFSVGQVAPGRRLGRTLAFPTLNLSWEPALRPPFGVYAVQVRGKVGPALPGVANYGLRPTVEQGSVSPLLEVHVLAGTSLTYGDEVTVQWLRFLRPESKFGSLDALRAQIENDRQEALRLLPELSAREFPKSA